MNTLIDIQLQIEKLKRQEADIRAKDFDSTVQDIVAKMNAFGITVKHIQSALARPGKGRGRKPSVKAKVAVVRKSGGGKPAPIKFRGPQGETWSGRGLMPKWLAALVADGKTREDFAV